MAAIAETRGLSNADLWQRIATWPLPYREVGKTWFTASHRISFVDWLERDLDLTRDSAARLETEYRRFLYLEALDGGRLTPSWWVDRAWHLHLAAPGDAWRGYCDTVLRRNVVHETGLTKEEARKGLERTIDLYRQEFEADPPADIWHYGHTDVQRRWAGGLAIFGVMLPLVLYLIAEISPETVPEPKAGVPIGVFLLFLGLLASKGTDLKQVD
jgi:hypothetical protein